MHIIPVPNYIHFNSFPLGCGISHAHTQNSFCIIKIHVGSVGQQQPIAPTWSRKGGSFSGLTEGTRMPQVAQLYRIIAGVCYPRALLPLTDSKRQDRVGDTSTIPFHFSKPFLFPKIQPMPLLHCSKLAKLLIQVKSHTLTTKNQLCQFIPIPISQF